MFATADDVNTYLPKGMLSVESGAFTAEDLDAQRVIRGYLSGVFSPTTVNAWASPDTTPEIIRGVAGRLIAALFYSRQLSAEDPNLNEYAQKLYNEAMQTLQAIAAGIILVLDPSTSLPVEVGHNPGQGDTWPNNNTQAPFFSVGQVF